MTRHRRRRPGRGRKALAWFVVLCLLVPLWVGPAALAFVVAFEPRHRHWITDELHPRRLVWAWRCIAGTNRPVRLHVAPPAHAAPPGPARPSGRALGIIRMRLAARDGLACQNRCGRDVDPDRPVNHPLYPHVHHLRPWHRNRFEWWVNALWNLCLLCAECNQRIGAGSTPVLDELAARLLAEEVRAGRLANA